ncbi:MAG: hypothetical protein AMXMBFR64_46430 [Myxococcales bacterium]
MRRPTLLLTLACLSAASGCTLQVEAADYIGVCAAGAERCKGASVQACSADGDRWLTREVCPADQICRDAACVPPDAPLLEPDGGEGDAAGDAVVTPTVDIVIPPLADGGPPTFGSVVDVTVRLQIVAALPGGYVDLGFCAGPLAGPVQGGPPTCAGAFFLRIERTGTGLWGQLYVHDPTDGTMEPKLWDQEAGVAAPVLLFPGELYELRLRDYAQQVSDAGERTMSFELRGFATSAWASQVVSVPDASLATFGLWNLDTAGTDEQALQGAASSVDIRIDQAQSWDIKDFSTLASTQGAILQSNRGNAVLDFHVTRAVAGLALLPLR